ncbi:MAG: CPBP family intramembrane glutamic endopeptidase [Phototrophicaceae bacterium]|jgi:membrane protease YdiL (CAAX protease family)
MTDSLPDALPSDNPLEAEATAHPASAQEIAQGGAFTQTPPASVNPTDETYEYLIDPFTGLPRLANENDEAPIRIRRAEVPDVAAEEENAIQYRSTASDPLFGYLVAVAVCFGLTPLLPDGSATRYTLSWGVLAGFGVVAWLLGNGERIGQEIPENLVWGIVFGAVTGLPLYLFGGETLTTTANILFGGIPPGAVLAYVIFVMPLGETLFFRGILQKRLNIWVTGALATVWSGVLFFPYIRTMTAFWAVLVFIFTILAIVNIVYSWVRQRNGLAAAWICQILVSLMLIYLPFIA